MNKPIEDIDERIIAESHIMEEVLAEPPRWIVRWGEAWVLLFLLTLLLGAGIIRYPDRLTAEAVVTTTSPPVEIKAPISGHIDRLFVNDLKPIHEHDVLLTIGDDYDWEDILFVESLLLQCLHRLDTFSLNHLFATELNLGPLQTSLQQAHVAYQNFLLESSLQPAFQQQMATGEELRQIELLIAEKRGQLEILTQKLSISQKDYDRHQLLHQKEAIADAELEAKENTWLDARHEVQAMAADIQQHQVAKARLEKEMMRFEHRHLHEAQKLQQELYVSLQELKTELISWKDRYIIMAPSSGKASFFSPLNEQQFIEQGEVLLHIIPDDESAIQAKLLVPTTNFGKVAIGQKVRLSLHSYPEKEFGRVEGKVYSISSMPQNGYYQVKASFPLGLKTSHDFQIPFSQNLTGQAEVITQDMSLLRRLTRTLSF
jgi:multidrug resistance efflux pump